MKSRGTPGERGSYRAGVSFGALSFGAVALLGLVGSIVTARLFGVKVIGEFALASAPTAALSLLSTVKEQTALIKELSQLPRRAPRVTGLFYATFAFSQGLTVLVAGIAAVVVFFVYRGPMHQEHLILPAYACLAAYTFVGNVCWNFDSVYSSFVAGRQMFWIRFHEAVMGLVFAILGGILIPNVWGLVLSAYGAWGTALVHRTIGVRAFMRFRVARAEIRDGFRTLPLLLGFAVRMAPGMIFAGLSAQSTTWVLGAMSTVSNVGAFNRAQMLSRKLQEFNQRLVEMLFPTLVSRQATGDSAGFDRALIDTLRYAAVMMLLLAAGAGGASHTLMKVFGSGFERADNAFSLLMLMPAVAAFTLIQSQALFAVNRPTVTSVTAGARLIATVAISIPATMAFGLVGPAIGLVVGSCVDMALKARTLKPHLQTPAHKLWPYRERVALLAAYVAGFVVARALDRSMSGYTGLLAAVPLVPLAYGAVFAALGGVNVRDRQRARPLVAKLRRRLGQRSVPDAV